MISFAESSIFHKSGDIFSNSGRVPNPNRVSNSKRFLNSDRVPNSVGV
jgi:hypothetical protein